MKDNHLSNDQKTSSEPDARRSTMPHEGEEEWVAPAIWVAPAMESIAIMHTYAIGLGNNDGAASHTNPTAS